MAYLLRQSVTDHPVDGESFILFDAHPRVLHAGTLLSCKDWLARFILRLEVRQISYQYDDLLMELRVDLPKSVPARVRRVAYQIKNSPTPCF